MMKLKSRAFRGQEDAEAVISWSLGYDEQLYHVRDLPYRLSSWSWDREDCGRIWLDADGAIKAYAVCHAAFQFLDFALDPAEADGGLEREVLRWGLEHAGHIAGMRSIHVHGRQTDHPWPAEVKRSLLFASELYMVRDLADWPEAVPESDYTVRQLESADIVRYVRLHRAAFESDTMNEDWKKRLLSLSHYRPGLDLVAESPDGSLAGFCTAWYFPDQQAGQIEPVGVHPSHREKGLARSLVSTALTFLRRCGAKTVGVNVFSGNVPAVSLYESCGFRVRKQLPVYRCALEQNV